MPQTDLVTAADSADAAVITAFLSRYRSANTRAAYAHDLMLFTSAMQKPLRLVTLGDLTHYQESLTGATTTQNRRVVAVRSLFKTCHRMGYIQYDPAALLVLDKPKDDLAARIIDEETALRVIHAEPGPRNACLLRVLYGAALRVSELCALTWSDVHQRDGRAVLVVYGKGQRTRHVTISATTTAALLAQRHDAPNDARIFPLHRSQVYRIVRRAGDRVGVHISPHFWRHAHASHALDRGAPLHVVSSTLGHTDPRTTQRYTHVRPGESSAAFIPV